MKNRIILILATLIPFWGTAQKYYTQENNEYIGISIDLERYSDAISVVKEVLTEPLGEEIDPNNLYLVGDFAKDDKGNIILNHNKYNYYFLLSQKKQPFFPINEQKKVAHGNLILNDNTSITDGDFIFCCSCNDQISTSNSVDGCQFEMTDKIIRIQSKDCDAVSFVFDHRKGNTNDTNTFKISSGGLLVQTTKPHFYHNFKINENMEPTRKVGF